MKFPQTKQIDNFTIDNDVEMIIKRLDLKDRKVTAGATL